jgi:FkbM family methyltransferase
MRQDLIIDVGMYKGADTDFYLRKGFKVVAVEANPDLARAAEERFAPQIADGSLKVLNVAIAEARGVARFAISDEAPYWSSMVPEFIARNEATGVRYRYVEVPAVPFEEVLREVGVPYYLKIDIEGHDMLCVKALHQMKERPKYVSVESNVSVNEADPEKVFDELAHLWVLGYRGFKYVDQQTVARQKPPQPAREGVYVDVTFESDGNSTGLFGEESPGDWEPVGRALRRSKWLRRHHNVAGFNGRYARTLPARLYSAFRRRILRLRPLGWYDLHAKLG